MTDYQIYRNAKAIVAPFVKRGEIWFLDPLPPVIADRVRRNANRRNWPSEKRKYAHGMKNEKGVAR